MENNNKLNVNESDKNHKGPSKQELSKDHHKAEMGSNSTDYI